MVIQSSPRNVIVSEPHTWSRFAKYGSHQYARVFARYGWRVVLITASFSLWRIFSPRPGISKAYLDLWRKRGRRIDDSTTEYCLAHLLPTWLRFRLPFNSFAHCFYLPSVRFILKKQGIEQVDLLWLHGDHDWLLRRAIPHKKLIVRIIDDYSAYGTGYNILHPLLRETLLAADGVFACSKYVQEKFASVLGINVRMVPNGVDFEHFSRSVDKEPDLLESIPRPRIVYIGAIAEWFDLDLVIELAHRLPHCHFVLIGNWLRQKPVLSEFPDNIHIMGPVEYDKLPAILTYSDVGLIPFKNIPLVQGISPIKVYEYLAASLPVVSLRWEELERESLPIFLANNVDEFERGIQEALAMPIDRRSYIREAVRACSWEQRLKEMLRYVGLSLDADEF
ncbi:MAG: glycosyltransferase [Candidatus Bathyarchaeia archaeon]